MGTFVAFLDHDDLLSERALYEVAAELDKHPDADLLYSDQDLMDGEGRRHTPYFKTDWNPDLLLGHNMISHLGVYRRSLVEQIGGMREGFEGSQDYDLALRIAAATNPARIRHIPAILYHWREVVGGASVSQTQLDRCVTAARLAIEDYLRGLSHAGAEVKPAPAARWWTRVRWPLPTIFPRVSVIVPTRDRADLLDRCTAGLLQRTDYPDMELVIVDNDTRELNAQAVLERLSKDSRVRVIRVPGPFNFAGLINTGVSAATGDVIVLLNNDVDVIDHAWLCELVSQAIRPEIGAVGAKLLYADTTVQYAGTVLGVGNPDGGPGVADHFGVHAARSDIGYMGFLALARQVSAVTAACMALRKDVFEAVGGMDADNLSVAYNDVDLCLRIRARGLSVIWTPFAELYHLESASRGPDYDSDKVERFKREWAFMRKRWGATLDEDPFYNPNFSWGNNTFQLAFPPRREDPWRKYMQPSVADADIVTTRFETRPTPQHAIPDHPRYVDWPPARENAGRAFEGEWSSAVPGLPSGHVALFDDERIKWFEERLGGFAGRRVLELGPLEGGHTCMMTQRGAQVLAIESNRNAWIRCIVVKDLLGMSGATFLLGDFVRYLQSKPHRYDFSLASGVLYHVTDPVGMLQNLAAVSDAVGLWTHYFDDVSLKKLDGIRDKFDYVPHIVTTSQGRQVGLHRQRYREALEWTGFCGGSAPTSAWMTREAILGVLYDEGFDCEVGLETPDHPHGPAFCVFARRRPAVS
jgi:O-antigen biosynthesis protein